MFNAKHSKTTTAVFMALTAMAATMTNLVNITPATAQLFPQQERERDYPREPDSRQPTRNNDTYQTNDIPEGFVIPVEYEKEKILVTPEETVPITLTVAANIRDSDRNVLIPYGTEIVGKIEPSGDGSRFVAEKLVFDDGTTQYIDATSEVVTRTETVKKGASTGEILKGAAIGGAAATVLSGILGKVDVIDVLGGAGAGALAGVLLGKEQAELISIDPNNDLNLTLQSDLTLR
jgi:hypothetical protein